MKSTVQLAFSAVMLGATAFWGVGHVVLAQRAAASDTNVTASPLGLVRSTGPRGAVSGISEAESRDRSDGSSSGESSPPLSPEAVDVIANDRRYWYDNGLWYVEDGTGLTAAKPPAGVVISEPPPMYATGSYGDGTPYYYALGVYYVRVDDGYAVTDALTFQH